jgi:hypothetical protein
MAVGNRRLRDAVSVRDSSENPLRRLLVVDHSTGLVEYFDDDVLEVVYVTKTHQGHNYI